MAAFAARALAKINLHLAVHARRADGYHELTTVLQSIALHDTIIVEAADGPFVLRCNDPGVPVPTDETNLVWRAALACVDVLGRKRLAGLRVTLDKQVPAQAGLGGGSADAIATLRALGCCWGIPMERDLLTAVGRRLGADVPFFVDGGTALGTGRGDQLAPLADIPHHALLVVRPPFGIGTADAYRWLAESRAARTSETSPGGPPASPGEWSGWLDSARNDFGPVVAARYPVIAETTAALRDAGAVMAMLCGSGSAVVGLFQAREAAAAASRPFEGRTGWRTWVSETVSRDEYRVAVKPAAR